MTDATDMPDVFGSRKGSQLVELIAVRKLYRGVMDNFNRDRGNGRNTYKRGSLAQKHRLEIDRLMVELKPEIVGGTDYENRD